MSDGARRLSERDIYASFFFSAPYEFGFGAIASASSLPHLNWQAPAVAKWRWLQTHREREHRTHRNLGGRAQQGSALHSERPMPCLDSEFSKRRPSWSQKACNTLSLP